MSELSNIKKKRLSITFCTVYLALHINFKQCRKKSSMTVNDEINYRLTQIWNKNQQYAENNTKYAPEFIFRKLNTNGLLFIGLNPSFSIKWMNDQRKSKGLPEDCERILT